ncbi:MAG TPA: hypothetical protein VJ803_12330 [Gemmatimonadaceae bacterium]|nr:hypothetical protein [Gemmatimonadaceae bacterium]
MHARNALLAGVLITILPVSHAAQEFTSTHTDCSELQLHDAKGVPNGTSHGYRFRGVCRELEKDGDDRIVRVRWEGWVEIESVYDTKSATFTEMASVKMSGHSSGPSSGTAQIILKCAQDPMLTSSKCTVMNSDVTTQWPDFVKAWLNGKPFTGGKVTLATATSLSSKSAAENPPPPPPGTSSPTLQDVAKKVGEALGGSAGAEGTTARTTGAPQRAEATVRPAPVPPARPEPVEIPLAAGTRISLQSGNVVAALPLEGELRWMIVGAEGEVLRTFPPGSRTFRAASNEILVDWGGGTYKAGPERRAPRLTLPR